MQSWSSKMAAMTEVAHDLVPSHIADILVRKQMAAKQQQHDGIDVSASTPRALMPLLSREECASRRARRRSLPAPGTLYAQQETLEYSSPSFVAKPQARSGTAEGSSSLDPAAAKTAPVTSGSPAGIYGWHPDQDSPLDSSVDQTLNFIGRSIPNTGDLDLPRHVSDKGSSNVPNSSPPTTGTQRHDEVIAFAHENVTILFAGRSVCHRCARQLSI